MEIERNRLLFDPLKKGEATKLRNEGCVVRKIEGKNCEFWLAPEVASFEVDNADVSSISMTQIAKGDIVMDVDTGIFKGVLDDERIDVLYWIEVTLMNVSFRQNGKYFTELSEAIDYYNKIKAFLEAEVK